MTRPHDRIVYINSWATFSPDGLYRHDLGRRWNDQLPLMAIIGLNPSSAGKDNDDPTIRRDVRFAWDTGHGGIWKVNLYDFVATNPRELAMPGIVMLSGCADEYIDGVMLARPKVATVVCAWGAHPLAALRADYVRFAARKAGRMLYCLGVTKTGAPRHPLYLPASARVVQWPSAVAAPCYAPIDGDPRPCGLTAGHDGEHSP